MDTSDREIVFSRTFDAPRELLFKAWTDPKHVIHWWGPNGFTSTIHEMNVKPGGTWRFIMHGPDGVDYSNKIIYDEIVEPEQIVCRHFGGKKDDNSVQFQMRVTFVEKNGKTELTMQLLFPSSKERDRAVKEYRADEGGNQTLGRLEKYLIIMAPQKEVSIIRIFDVPRDLVFQAWVDPQHLAEWWGPNGFTNPVCKIDPRPNGKIRIDMTGPDGTVYPMGGRFHEVVRPQRLVFTATSFEDEKGNAKLETHNTITFEDYKGKTKLTLRAIVIKFTEDIKPALDGMEIGWVQTLDRLEELVKVLKQN
jgi:uncharacterized protein YndB with AHSA1/START domain